MFPSIQRTLLFLARTPLVPPAPGPAMVELTTLSGPSRPRAASRTFSNLSVKSSYGYPMEGPSSAASMAITSAGGASSRPMLSPRTSFGRAGAIGGQRYASDHGKKELYSDEAGSTGAGTDDVAHTDAAFNKDPNPSSSAKQIEQEAGKDFTNHSPANPDYTNPPGKQGAENSDVPLNTSKEAKK